MCMCGCITDSRLRVAWLYFAQNSDFVSFFFFSQNVTSTLSSPKSFFSVASILSSSKKLTSISSFSKVTSIAFETNESSFLGCVE